MEPSPEDLLILESLQKAVDEALDRKQRLGQYAVVWRDGKPAFIGDEMPNLLCSIPEQSKL